MRLSSLWTICLAALALMLWTPGVSHAQPNYEKRVIDSANDFGYPAVGDLDRDGSLDIVAIASENVGEPDSPEYMFDIRWYQNQIAQQPNDSSGFSGTHFITSEMKNPRVMRIADLNGDTWPDVVTASTSGDKISWFENRLQTESDANSEFGNEQVITTDADNITTFATADLDGDGDTDILSGTGGADHSEEYAIDREDQSAPRVAWYENTGDGTFRGPHIITDAIGSVQTVRTSDLDGDGDQDVVTAAFGRVAPGTSAYEKQGVVWYENLTGDGSANDRFSEARTIAAAADFDWQASTFMFHHVSPVDLDADGDPDVIYKANYNPTKSYWQENLIGEGSSGEDFRPVDDEDAPRLGALEIQPDTVAARGRWEEGVFSILIRTDFFGTEDRDIDGTGLEIESSTVYVEDLDGDGYLDVVGAGDGNLSWFENRSRIESDFECLERLVSKKKYIEKYGEPDEKSEFTRIVDKWIYDMGPIRAEIYIRDGDEVMDCEYWEKGEK